VHGSAPDIAGKGVANPTAMILSVVLMLQFLKENREALKLEQSLLNVLKEGKSVTPDLGGTSTTMEMAQAVKDNYQKI
jgi:methanogen homoisocitrate dehydrogenase